jgi:archaellum biogenesis ATPase FlaH
MGKDKLIEQKHLDDLYQKAHISKNSDNIIDSIKQIYLYKDMIKIKNILNKLKNVTKHFSY